MFIRGIGRTKFGVLGESISELMYEAALKAKIDAGIEIDKIDACIVTNFLGGILDNQLHLNSMMANILPGFDVPCIRVESACASGGAGVFLGTRLLEEYNSVLVLGVEKMTHRDNTTVTTALAAAADYETEQKKGLIFPAAYALVASSYFEKYGSSIADLTKVALKSHHNANLNPLAHFHHKKITVEDIEKSPVICSPLRLFDSSPVSDGAAAVILSKHRNTGRDVEILASEMAIDSISIAQRKDITCNAATKKAAEKAFKKARITRDDISIAEVHDCFTINELVSLESLGLCEGGEAARLDTKIDGDLPTNTDGGLKANGHPVGASGIAQICEVVTQLRQEAGQRQVANPKYGLAHNLGGSGGSAIVTLLGGGPDV